VAHASVPGAAHHEQHVHRLENEPVHTAKRVLNYSSCSTRGQPIRALFLVKIIGDPPPPPKICKIQFVMQWASLVVGADHGQDALGAKDVGATLRHQLLHSDMNSVNIHSASASDRRL